MHQPRPYGQLTVGGPLSVEDDAAVEQLARRLTNLKQLSGVDSLRMVRALPDGGYVIAQDMGGVFRVITHKPDAEQAPPPFDGIARDYVPMLFCGVVTNAVLFPGQGLGMRITEATRRRISGRDPEKLPPKTLELQRFRVGYNQLVQELAPQFETVLFYSQYAAQRPTWYSGAMAEVMQIVGGYGRQDMRELPDNPIERARMLLPDGVREAVLLELAGVRLPGYTGLPPVDGQFQYDYKFTNTNAVGFDDRGRPWLLRVRAAGVHAMPLPLVPATTTRAFREWIEEVGDEEILAILDRFGGMPSGEGFPTRTADFEAWRRAGVIVKVCGAGDFYNHISYTSAIGWSFNGQGSEGFNTCYDYYDEEGLGYGLAFKMKLNLVAADADGKLPPPVLPDDPFERGVLNRYLESLLQSAAGNEPKNQAIRYKLRRTSMAELLVRARRGAEGQGEVEYWDQLELPPIAAHTGSVSEVGRGYLYHGAPFPNQPQIKFPEPFMGGCISHDFLPLINGRYKDSYPNSDTIMFGYYIDDELKVVKYFREGRSFDRDEENDFEDCMIVGSWNQTLSAGGTQLLGNFYTTDFDERREVSAQVTQTHIVGKDLGYDSKPWFEFDAPFWRPGTMWRNRYFSHTTTSESTSGNSLAVAICIPYLCRNAVLHAKREGKSGGIKTNGASLQFVRDPTSYRFWTYDFVMHWAGGLPVMKGVPSPKDGNPVWVEIEEYGPYPCSDFADQGPWVPALPADYTWLIHPQRNVWQLSGGGGAPSFKAYSTTTQQPSSEKGALHISVLSQPEPVHARVPDKMYFLGSPDEFVGVFYRDATRIVFGQSIYANVSESEEQTPGSLRRRYGFTSLADHKSAHHFLGVINE